MVERVRRHGKLLSHTHTQIPEMYWRSDFENEDSKLVSFSTFCKQQQKASKNLQQCKGHGTSVTLTAMLSLAELNCLTARRHHFFAPSQLQKVYSDFFRSLLVLRLRSSKRLAVSQLRPSANQNFLPTRRFSFFYKVVPNQKNDTYRQFKAFRHLVRVGDREPEAALTHCRSLLVSGLETTKPDSSLLPPVIRGHLCVR